MPPWMYSNESKYSTVRVKVTHSMNAKVKKTKIIPVIFNALACASLTSMSYLPM